MAAIKIFDHKDSISNSNSVSPVLISRIFSITHPHMRNGYESRLNESSTKIDPDITCTTHDPNQYRDIRRFLESSLPPMTHLMDAFIDFGCVNAAFLHTVSSWSIEKIRDVLNQLTLGPTGKKITEMDKFILENHFKEYFSQR